MTTLIIGPIVAASLVAAGQPEAGHPTTNAVLTDVQTAVRIELRSAPFAVAESLRQQTPPPAPVAPPARVAVAPKPRPHIVVPPAPSASPSSVIGIIEAAAARWGVSGSWMVNIARCESGLRPNAVNPRGPYLGLFQFLQSTFRANGGTNIWSATDQANIAAKMLAHGQAWQWSCA